MVGLVVTPLAPESFRSLRVKVSDTSVSHRRSLKSWTLNRRSTLAFSGHGEGHYRYFTVSLDTFFTTTA